MYILLGVTINELYNINNTSSMRFLESLPNIEIVVEASKFSNMASNEANIELPNHPANITLSRTFSFLLNQ